MNWNSEVQGPVRPLGRGGGRDSWRNAEKVFMSNLTSRSATDCYGGIRWQRHASICPEAIPGGARVGCENRDVEVIQHSSLRPLCVSRTRKNTLFLQRLSEEIGHHHTQIASITIFWNKDVSFFEKVNSWIHPCNTREN